MTSIYEEEPRSVNTPPGTVIHPETDIIYRVSDMGNYDLCMGRVAHRYDPGYSDQLSEPMLFGTTLHNLIEREIVQGLPVPRESLASYSEEVIRDKEDVDLNDYVEDMGVWVDELDTLMISWRSWWRSGSIEPEHVEYPMGVPIGDGIWLCGTADLIARVGGELVAFDWKTARRDWQASKADAHYQQNLYAYLYNEINEEPLRRFTYLVGNRRTGRWEAHSRTVWPDLMRAELFRYKAFVNAQEKGAIVYTPRDPSTGKRAWYCKKEYCGAWAICPARKLYDEYDNEE